MTSAAVNAERRNAPQNTPQTNPENRTSHPITTLAIRKSTSAPLVGKEKAKEFAA
jgi:hypothetical protein